MNPKNVSEAALTDAVSIIQRDDEFIYKKGDVFKAAFAPLEFTPNDEIKRLALELTEKGYADVGQVLLNYSHVR